MQQSFREPDGTQHVHENGFQLHGGGQLVAAENGGYFIKNEPEMCEEVGVNKVEGLLGENGTGAGDESKDLPPAPASITVPLTMLANVVMVNGRNCILEPPATEVKLEGEEESPGNENVYAGEKGRHVEVVDCGGEKRRYLTLSAGRQQRATNRLRLNVIRTEHGEQAEGKAGEDSGASGVGTGSAQDYPGIDTWFTQIPKPTYVNCFKLCKLGSSAVLSRRYLNIRQSLIMNMAASQGLAGGSPAAVAALNRSNSQTAGNSPVGGSGGVDKVNNFVERIKV